MEKEHERSCCNLKDIGNLLFKAICCPFWIDMSYQKFLYFSLIESRKIGNVCTQCVPHEPQT